MLGRLGTHIDQGGNLGESLMTGDGMACWVDIYDWNPDR